MQGGFDENHIVATFNIHFSVSVMSLSGIVAHISLRIVDGSASLIYHNIFFGYLGSKNYKLESNRRKDPGNSLSSSGRAMINWPIFYSETHRCNLISLSFTSVVIYNRSKF